MKFCESNLRLALSISLLGAAACDQAAKDTTPSRSVEPQTVEVAGGSTTLGFAQGVLRSEAQVASFRISRYPTSRKEYAACVDADACPSVSCVAEEEANSDTGARPVDCVSLQAAEQFCQWVGGNLPTLAQWLRAARGETPVRFPWGEGEPTCERHPWAGAYASARTGSPEAGVGRGAPKCDLSSPHLVIGKHKSGAAPSGMEDILLTSAELALSSEESPFASCSSSSNAACTLYGLEGGAIDGVSGAGPAGAELVATGFRCVWEK